MSQQVIIFDTTLRDGEQALQASLSVKEKLQIALALERMGIDVMEVGFPVSSPGDFESVQTIARQVKNSRFPYSYVYRHLADAHRDEITQYAG